MGELLERREKIAFGEPYMLQISISMYVNR